MSVTNCIRPVALFEVGVKDKPPPHRRERPTIFPEWETPA